MSWLSGLAEDYRKVFVDSWSPYVGAMLLVVVSAVLMASGLFWGVFGGLKLWGDYLNQFLGLGPLLGIKPNLDSPLMHRISLMDITLLLGAFSAALMAQQFRINRPPKLEYIWAAIGGSLMGVGATLAGGCTTGGFFTPLIFSSPAGWIMLLGLLPGADIGLKILLWGMEHITWGTTPPPTKGASSLKPYYPLIGVAVLVLVLWWAASWAISEEKQLTSRAIIIFAGFAIGFILHRSRFCFSRVFREPFMTGEGDMTKAMIVALALGIPVASILLQHKTVDPYLAIPATFWLGSLLGGLVFGIGMVLAGGCASGSLWRLGEGHIKLLVAVFFFGWVGSLFSGILKKAQVNVAELDIDFMDGMAEVSKLGFQAYLPDLLEGWPWLYVTSFAVLLLWYLLVRYNESSNKFTVI